MIGSQLDALKPLIPGAPNAIFEYREFFHSRQRCHPALGLRTPIEYERMHYETLTVARASQMN